MRALPIADLFAKQQSIRILTFNALKLRTQRADLAEDWAQLLQLFSECDVVMLQEVPAKDDTFNDRFTRRIYEPLLEYDASWRYVRSSPSGATRQGTKDKEDKVGFEVHVVLYRAPVERVPRVQTSTLATIGGVFMAHAPFVVTVRAHGLTFTVVSVHAPPSSSNRRPERDRQLRALLGSYPLAGELRNDRPFRRYERNFELHLIGGDLNASPGELSAFATEVAKDTWHLALGGDKGTPTGKFKAYDNFLHNADDVFYRTWTPSCAVLRLAPSKLANFAASQQGISDHSPVLFTLLRSVE